MTKKRVGNPQEPVADAVTFIILVYTLWQISKIIKFEFFGISLIALLLSSLVVATAILLKEAEKR